MSNQFFSPEGDLEKYYVTEYQLVDDYVGSQVLTWGRNTDGQLGIGEANSNLTLNTPTLVSVDSNQWRKISVSNDFVTAIKTDGSLWTWGDNSHGQLGTKDYSNRNAPTQVGIGSYWVKLSSGGYHTTVIRDDGTLWACGRNDSAQLGLGYTSTSGITTLTKVGVGSDWKINSPSGAFNAAIKIDGSLWTWGRNSYGRLGINDTNVNRIVTSPTEVYVAVGQTNRGWKTVSTGVHVVTAIKEDGTLWTWGNNTGITVTDQGQVLGDPIGIGQLGLGVEDPYIDRYVPTQIGNSDQWKLCSSGRTHSAAIKKDGSLWTWGDNSRSQLGIVGISSAVVPTRVGSGVDWKFVDCSHSNTFAIKTDGSLWASGNNEDFQLTSTDTNEEFQEFTNITKGSSNWKYVENRVSITAGLTLGVSPNI